jgi:hypothetical protein
MDRPDRSGDLLLPEPPDPPPDETLTGADGRPHRFRYRLWRAPTGIVAEAEEADRAPGDGYNFKVMGPHDAIVDRLLEALRAHMLRGLRRLHLEPLGRAAALGDERDRARDQRHGTDKLDLRRIRDCSDGWVARGNPKARGSWRFETSVRDDAESRLRM